VFARAVLRLENGGVKPTHMALRRVLGPTGPAPQLETTVSTSVEAGGALCREIVAHVDQTGHLPSSLTVEGASGGVPVGPGPVLKAVAAALLELDAGKVFAGLTFRPGAEEPAVAAPLIEETFSQFLGWPPHPPDLRLDQMALHMRLQSWSLKPAVLAS
jgi:hypothetical protein